MLRSQPLMKVMFRCELGLYNVKDMLVLFAHNIIIKNFAIMVDQNISYEVLSCFDGSIVIEAVVVDFGMKFY